jgi:hypothetical protein
MYSHHKNISIGIGIKKEAGWGDTIEKEQKMV